MASDYSIAQFRFLQRLLLIHGRWSYMRLCELVLYSFYKNLTFVLCQFWFAILSLFAGQTLFDSVYATVFNLAATSLPIIIYACFEQDVGQEENLAYPILYMNGQRNKGYNGRLFLRYMGRAALHATLVFLIPLFAFIHGTGTNGRLFGMWAEGTVVFNFIIVVVNLVVALETRFWVSLTHLAIWGSIIGWFIFLTLYSLIPAVETTYHVVSHLATSTAFWLLLVLVPVACLLIDVTWYYIKRNFLPSKVHIVQELQKLATSRKEARRDFYKKATPSSQATRHTGFAFAYEDSVPETKGNLAERTRWWQRDKAKREPARAITEAT